MRYNSFEITSTTKSNRSISSVAINGDKTTVDLNYMQNGYYERRQSEVGDNAYSAFNVKKFISEYGFAIFAVITVIALIVIITPLKSSFIVTDYLSDILCHHTPLDSVTLKI